ncbi:MAG: PAS domain S-box protein [Archangiaceae bacterium]|nr:PAS domain S-box protein [Archangiaceae bacterium]
MLWNRLTAPSPRLQEGLEQRQARVLAGALVFILPIWCVALGTAIATRSIPITLGEWGIAAVNTGLGFAAYALSRTRHYRVGVWVLVITSVLGSHISASVEPERVRAVVSMLYGATGALYAAVFMNTRATLLAACGTLLSFIVFGSLHPSLSGADFVLPMFLLGFILALTVVAAAVREAQLKTIQAQADHLTAIYESATDAVAVIDGKGLVQDWSPRAELLFGFDAGRALGMPLVELVSRADDRPRLEAALTTGAARFEFHSAGPTPRSYEAAIAPLKRGAGAVVAMRDVTERKQMEARLMLTDRLETMGRMVAGVAHEINNPLAYVQANLRSLNEELTQPEMNPKERRELVAETLDGTVRIQSIVKDLLTFSRNTGEHEAIVPVNVEATLDSALQIARVHVTRSNATVIRQYSNVGAVNGIEARLGQVFLTLIMNAVQALPAEGGRRELLVSTRREGPRVIVGVRDFGAGMSPETRARLFTPFFTTKPVGKGTGLGLSIAHSIVTALGGEIRVESAPGQGALFEVALPITQADATAASDE